MQCLFSEPEYRRGAWVYTCSQCRRQWRLKTRVDPGLAHRQCTNGAHRPPLAEAAGRLGISLSDVAHYGKALFMWGAAGFPERSDEEVARLLAICQACEHYTQGRCRKCGCRVSNAPALINKIRMATENCPIGKWL
jgi:hypothetical protein